MGAACGESARFDAVVPDGVGSEQQALRRYGQAITTSLPDRKTGVGVVHIPKGDGRTTRPTGIPTFEDKVLQRAVLALLEPLYEQDFMECSYGFRPGRSAHQAVETVRNGLMSMGGGWVIDLDIKAFFDTIDHQHLRTFLQQRVKDGVILRLIGKWLKAGVLERAVAEGRDRQPTKGCDYATYDLA